MLVDAFGESAANYQAAGYDGIEIGAGHGYLIAQFLSSASNQRTDAFMAIPSTAAYASSSRWLKRFARVAARATHWGFALAPTKRRRAAHAGGHPGNSPSSRSAAPVDYLSITVGVRGGYVKDSSWNEGFALDLAGAVKMVVDVPVIAGGRIRQPDLAERALTDGQADFIGLGRALVADPEWTNKARLGRVGEIRPCLGIVQDCRRAEGIIGCAVNARTGREASWGPVEWRESESESLLPAPDRGASKQLESLPRLDITSSSSSARNQTGGQLRIAAAGPTREELMDFVFYLEREVKRLGVDLRLGTAATKESVLELQPNLLVVATGATPLAPDFAFDEGAKVVTVWDLLGLRVNERPDGPSCSTMPSASGTASAQPSSWQNGGRRWNYCLRVERSAWPSLLRVWPACTSASPPTASRCARWSRSWT